VPEGHDAGPASRPWRAVFILAGTVRVPVGVALAAVIEPVALAVAAGDVPVPVALAAVIFADALDTSSAAAGLLRKL
jgi:hypothetical protein